LKDLGVNATVVNCDVTDRPSVAALLETASGLGTVASVIHTAGVSPSMGDADYVMRTNALGTLNVNEVFFAAAGEGSAIVNVASMAAHMLPASLTPTGHFPLALRDEDAFMEQMTSVCSIAPTDARSGLAYAVSKSFVRWYSTSQCERFNDPDAPHRLGLPGSVDTEDGSAREAGPGQGRDGHRCRGPAVKGMPEEMAELYSPSVPATGPATSPARTSSTMAGQSPR
jgi:NAD(P)-dependent dehydrogenase (short-subunit alcohol dehydrogenase family)